MKTKLVIWLAACLIIAILPFNDLWAKLLQWLSPQGLQYHGVFHWGVLALCVLWLWLKRTAILSRMATGWPNLPFLLTGAAILALSIFLPGTDDLLLFLMLLGWLGAFTMIFGRAATVPSLLLTIYGFSIVFPIFMMEWLGQASVTPVARTLTAITTLLGLPVEIRGAVIDISSRSGNVISVLITPECAGYQTIGVFIALFSLMMIDIRLPLKKAWYVFLIGLAGTWLQNVIRVLISVVAGYYWGAGVIETIHFNISYVIFPLWYILFAYIYLRQAGWRRTSVSA